MKKPARMIQAGFFVLRYLSSHAHALAAGLLAAAARFGALLAMGHVGTMLFALVAAGLADFGTLL